MPRSTRKLKMKYSTKWPDLRSAKCSHASVSRDAWGNSQWSNGMMMRPVACAEKVWVERAKITTAQAIAGPHCRSQRMLAERPQARGWKLRLVLHCAWAPEVVSVPWIRHAARVHGWIIPHDSSAPRA